MPLNALSERVLGDWFTRAVKACGGDVQAYDFMHEIDRSLTYEENKAKLDRVVAGICGGPVKMGARKAAKYQKAIEDAAFKAFQDCLDETADCQYCDRVFYGRQFNMQAAQMRASHEKACHVGEQKKKGAARTYEEIEAEQLRERAQYGDSAYY